MTTELSIAPTADASRSPTPAPKLVKATQQFEAILLSSWLEKLEESYAGTGDDTDPAHGTLASMGAEAMASALAARGGIGISKMLLQQLAKSGGGGESSLTTLAPWTSSGQTAGRGKDQVKVSLDSVDKR